MYHDITKTKQNFDTRAQFIRTRNLEVLKLVMHCDSQFSNALLTLTLVY